MLDAVTAGTGAASKALVLNSSSGISGGVNAFHSGRYSIANSGTKAGGDGALVYALSRERTGITNNSAASLWTVSVPNAAHNAAYKVTVTTYLGAGGAVGAGEAASVQTYYGVLARTAGVDTVKGLSSAVGGATAAVAGAATNTTTITQSANSGTSAQTQTYDIQVTIARGSGSSDNHYCKAVFELLETRSSGIAISVSA